MSKNIHSRHGENIHKMEQIPENPTAKGPYVDLLKSSRGNIPPAELKRITGKTAKRQTKRSKQTQA
jgi:hypothetical protein